MLNIKRIDDELVELEGRFDASQVEKAEIVLSGFTVSFTVDMAHLEYISSAGLGVLLKNLVRLKDSGKSLTLKNMNKHIREVLKYSGLDKLFLVEESGNN